jgi:hypothetical protein
VLTTATATALAATTLLTALTAAGLFATTTLLATLLVTLVSLILFRHPCFPPWLVSDAIVYLKSLSFSEG